MFQMQWNGRMGYYRLTFQKFMSLCVFMRRKEKKEERNISSPNFIHHGYFVCNESLPCFCLKGSFVKCLIFFTPLMISAQNSGKHWLGTYLALKPPVMYTHNERIFENVGLYLTNGEISPSWFSHGILAKTSRS